MRKIGIIRVEGHHFPNFALLKIAGYYLNKGIPEILLINNYIIMKYGKECKNRGKREKQPAGE